MYAIETKDLALKQGTKFLVKDVNWQVEAQEHWVIFGLNGCGKTTLLSMIAGYRGSTHGEISLFGQTLTAENALDLRRQIGFVSGSYFDSIYQYENVLNIVLGGLFGGLGERYDIMDNEVRKAKELLKAFGLGAKASYPYDLLSKGQRQRVLLARALMPEPKLLILDEPCTGLDIFGRDFFLNTLTDIVKETAVTVIYVTHHGDEILPFYTKALLLKKGIVHSKGRINDIFSQDNLTNFFDKPTSVQWVGGKVSFNIADKLKMSQEIWQ